LAFVVAFAQALMSAIIGLIWRKKHDVAVRVKVLVGILCCGPGIYATVDSGLNE